MKRVLLTGMSGTGKSTVIAALAARGYKAIDLDTDEWSHWVPVRGDGGGGADPTTAPTATAAAAEPDVVWQNWDWVWREDRIQRLLSTEDANVLFVSGCSPNQGKFRAQFDHVILLSAPTPVIVERLSSRTNNPYGKHPYELAKVMGEVETVEPLLRRGASLEVDTSAPVEQVVQTILTFVQQDRREVR